MLPAFRAGAGGPLGPGTQLFPWVALDDVLDAIVHSATSPALAGPVDVVAPGSPTTTSAGFAKTLSGVLGRPWPLNTVPVPAALLRGVMGEMGEATLLCSVRGDGGRALQETGFEFGYPELRGCLEHQLGM
jgi:NAD dependent epimerase/dehydratase family enzyme